jgi:hypothetical protein
MRVVGISAALGVAAAALAGCGGSTSPSDEVRSAIKTSASVPDKATCAKSFTDRGLMAYYRETSVAAAKQDCAAEAGKKATQDRVKGLQISDIRVSGDTATARAQLNGRKARYSLVRQGGAWKVDGIAAVATTAATTPTTATTTPSAAATSTTSSGPNTSRLALEVAARRYNSDSQRFIKRVRADAGAKDLAAVKADTSQFRDAVFSFDSQVRQISPADSARDEYNALLEANRTTIADLDAIGSAPTPAEFGRLFRSHLVPDTQTLIDAEARLYDAL